VSRSEAALSQAKASQAQMEASLLRTQRDLDRFLALRARDSLLVSGQQVDDARTGVEVSAAQLRSAQFGVSQAQASLDEAQDRLSKTIIRAPIAGKVTRRNVEEGETVIIGTMNNPGSLVLAISDLSVIEVVVQVDETGRILRFQEKPKHEEAVSNLVNMGVYIFEPPILDLIPPGEVYDFGHQLFPRLLEEGVPFYGYRADCYWSDVGSFGEYRRAQSAILGGEVRGIRIPGRQVAEGIWQGRGVGVHPRARLVPPVVIGDNCQVRADAIVGPETVLGSHVIVDEGATVVGSTVLDGTYVGRLVNVQEAVVNRNCLVSVPASASVFVADRFLLGEVGEEALVRGLGRALEWAGALALFLASLPLWPLAALLARLSGPGPLLVLRESATSDPQALRETGRVGWRAVQVRRFRADPSARAGRLLHRLGLAGLPGLLHVLRGDLALSQ
jgi:NDP-sugar pyrophosphorylase family protein